MYDYYYIIPLFQSTNCTPLHSTWSMQLLHSYNHRNFDCTRLFHTWKQCSGTLHTKCQTKSICIPRIRQKFWSNNKMLFQPSVISDSSACWHFSAPLIRMSSSGSDFTFPTYCALYFYITPLGATKAPGNISHGGSTMTEFYLDSDFSTCHIPSTIGIRVHHNQSMAQSTTSILDSYYILFSTYFW